MPDAPDVTVPAFHDVWDMGDCCCHFIVAGKTVSVDLLGFHQWYSSLFSRTPKLDGNQIIAEVVNRVAETQGVELTLDEADHLVHGIAVRQAQLMSFRAAQLSQARNSGSTS